MKHRNLILAAVVMLGAAPRLFAQPPAPTTRPAADMEALEQKLAQTLSDSVTVGRFTLDGDDQVPKQDHYTLGKVKKLENGLWLIPARIQYGQHDITLPITLPVEWAGDTPVITVTDLGFPGLGKYTARVLIYGDHYAGTWSASPTHGGTLFGRIEHPAPASRPATEQNK